MIIRDFISDQEEEIRLDVFLQKQDTELSRTYIQKLIKEGYVNVNGALAKSNYKVKCEDRIRLHIPKAQELDIIAQDIPLDIVYEDEDVILINKPKNMVVHPAVGHYTGTLVNALLYHCKDKLSGINGMLRPGIVHRIDMDTTGIIIACKNDAAHRAISEQLKEHSITRRYRAVVYGRMKEDEGTVSKVIGRHPIDRKRMAVDVQNGKEAITHYRVLEKFKDSSYIECILETGRTHQIRVHMASIGHPLVGDKVYGREKERYNVDGQVLHAQVLGFVHPSTGEYREFFSPLPDYFEDLLKKMRLEE